MKIIKNIDLESCKWSGGTTTEVYIAPAHANYQERVFEIRISTATVSSLESDFTPLAGVKRHLMILEGEMELIHEGEYSKVLKPYEQDDFLGEYKTSSKSISTVVDFNLMMKGAFQGTLSHYSLKGNKELHFNEEHIKLQHKGFYCHTGKAKAIVNDVVERLEQGDYLLVDASEYSKNLEFLGDAELIEVTVWSE